MRSNREHRHASIIIRNGTPVIFGYNSENEHSEEDAIYSDKKWVKQNPGLVMLNFRLTKGGKIGLSKPCLACMDLLKEYKFRKVIYTTNLGTLEEIYL